MVNKVTMLKYVDTKVTFSEVPDEISLCISISNCPNHCKGCHSPYLAEDIGKPLIEYPKNMLSDEYIIHIDELIEANKGITCVCLMGGDNDVVLINVLASFIKKEHNLKVAWYSGKSYIEPFISFQYYDYIKIGPYKEEFGPLNSKTTNQRMYKVDVEHYDDGNFGYELVDITKKFWKDDD